MSKSETLGVRLNNPGNIRYNVHNRFRGLAGQENGFCRFESLLLGCRAMCVVIRNYMRRGVDSLRGIIYRYAPPADSNPTESYITYVRTRIELMTGLPRGSFDINQRIYWSGSIFPFLIQAMIRYESGLDLSLEFINNAISIMD